MTTATAPTTGISPNAPKGGAVVTPVWRNPAALTMAGLLVVGLAGLFATWFYRQHRFSMEQSADWGHAYLVPLIALFYVWKQRGRLAVAPMSVFWPGLLPVLVGVATYITLSLVPFPGIHMFQGVAIVLSVAGLTLLLLGPRIFPLLVFPLGYLLFGVTIAEMVMIKITFQLQLLASQGAALMLRLMLFTVELDGNTIKLSLSNGDTVPLNVAEACSGMRMVIAFLALGVAVAFFSCEKWWQRVALVMLAAPVALLTNVVRVVSLGIASIWDRELAAGDAHTLIGVLWLIPGFLLFMGLVWTLKKIIQEDAAPAPAQPASPATTPRLGWSALGTPAFVVSMALLAVASVGLRAAVAAKGVYLSKRPIYADGGLAFHSMPTRYASWERVGTDTVLSAEMLETLGTQNYLSRWYVPTVGDKTRGVELHLAYYTNMIDSVPHVPERCFVGAGWTIDGPSKIVPVALDMDRFFVDRDADAERHGGVIYKGHDTFGREVRLPRGVRDLRLNVTPFKHSGSEKRVYSGYFFVANGGIVPRAEDVRLLAFNLAERYAFYAKVQFTSVTAESEEDLGRLAGMMLNEMFPDIMRRVPDWVDVTEGRYPQSGAAGADTAGHPPGGNG